MPLTTRALCTPNQERYVQALRGKKPIVVAVGPAGTGKTYLACQQGIQQLINSHTKRLVVTRPVAPVGDDHGYLPGDIKQKLAPWLQPIYDSISKYDSKDLKKNKVQNAIEIAPLAYMRGRTFEHSWIIADEMQNATPEQTKMLLTRLGEGSKLVLTGDVQQCDIERSGLVDFIERLKDFGTSEYVEYVSLDAGDIARHEAVKEIIEIYDSTQML